MECCSGTEVGKKGNGRRRRRTDGRTDGMEELVILRADSLSFSINIQQSTCFNVVLLVCVLVLCVRKRAVCIKSCMCPCCRWWCWMIAALPTTKTVTSQGRNTRQACWGVANTELNWIQWNKPLLSNINLFSFGTFIVKKSSWSSDMPSSISLLLCGGRTTTPPEGCRGK